MTISRQSLLTSKQYERLRTEWKQRVIPFKKLRTLHLGPSVTLVFENELTIRYQLQEMIRVNQLLEETDLEHELAIYNELLPANGYLKATLMFEFVDKDIRDSKLSQMVGAAERVWISVDGRPRVYSKPLQALEERDQSRASTIYFVTFELDLESRNRFISGEAVAVGIDHPHCQYEIEEMAPEMQYVLTEDLRIKT